MLSKRSILCIISLFLIIQLSVIPSVAQEIKEEQKQEETIKIRIKKIQKFWKWFKKNEAKLSKPFTYPESQIDLVNKLGNVNEGLEYSLDVNESKYTLTITCNGNSDLIPVVKSVVENAPKFEFWNVVAFKQITEIPDSLYFDEVVIFAKDLKIYLVNDQKSVHINAFLKDYSKEDERKIQLVKDYLTKAVGEYSLMTDVSEIKLQLSENYRVYMQTVSIFELKNAIENEKKMFYSK